MTSLNETLQRRRFCNVARHFHRNYMVTSEQRWIATSQQRCNDVMVSAGYEWAKFFVPLLRHLTFSEFTSKDSFEFVKIICEQDTGLFMASVDIESLFNNVPLEETINICVYELFKSNSIIHGLNKNHITEILSLTTKDSIILFDMAFCTQGDGLAMGSPLGLLLANAFLCHHETKWLHDSR